MSESRLADRIRNGSARVTVIGQGYVGLPLAVEFARAGFNTTGLDTDLDRVIALNAGQSYTPDVDSELLKTVIEAGRYEATSEASTLERSDVVIICVPTPLRKSKDPDISFVVAAAENVAAHFRPGQLVVLESTTYPGSTEELLLPMFEARGARVGEELFVAFSPEHIDPGNPVYKVGNIPKVVGGVTPACTALAAALYQQIVPRASWCWASPTSAVSVTRASRRPTSSSPTCVGWAPRSPTLIRTSRPSPTSKPLGPRRTCCARPTATSSSPITRSSTTKSSPGR